MGYTRIVQYGNITEKYEYENNRPDYKERHISPIAKKRAKEIRAIKKKTGTYKRSKDSIQRSRKSFFRLCHHNNCIASTIAFLTLTFAYDITLSKASRHVRRFMEKLKSDCKEVSISYISVVEITKKNRYHFHLLVYNLPSEKIKKERTTRNIQRLFERGYVDIRLATYTSKGIAGYMAKYMAKSFDDEKTETTRGFTCSRNIAKTYSAGSNSLDQYTDYIVPTDNIDETEKREYDVPYLGKCLFTKITTKI